MTGLKTLTQGLKGSQDIVTDVSKLPEVRKPSPRIQSVSFRQNQNGNDNSGFRWDLN